MCCMSQVAIVNLGLKLKETFFFKEYLSKVSRGLKNEDKFTET